MVNRTGREMDEVRIDNSNGEVRLPFFSIKLISNSKKNDMLYLVSTIVVNENDILFISNNNLYKKESGTIGKDLND